MISKQKASYILSIVSFDKKARHFSHDNRLCFLDADHKIFQVFVVMLRFFVYILTQIF